MVQVVVGEAVVVVAASYSEEVAVGVTDKVDRISTVSI
jgi:hypothetical protein